MCHMLTYPTIPLPKTSPHALKISCFLMPLQLWTCFYSVFIPVPTHTFFFFWSPCKPTSYIIACIMSALATTSRAGHHSQPGIISYSSFFLVSPSITLIKCMLDFLTLCSKSLRLSYSLALSFLPEPAVFWYTLDHLQVYD